VSEACKDAAINEEMLENEEGNISNYIDIRYLSPETTKFEKTNGGFVSMHIEPDENYPRVNFYRAFPFKFSREFISVRDVEGKEIGIIRSIDDFPPKDIELIEMELSRRYFRPVITKINSIKDEFGYTYWNVITDAGPKKFTVQRNQNSVISLTEKNILIIDVDGNRYEIPDYTKLDPKSMKIVEMLL